MHLYNISIFFRSTEYLTHELRRILIFYKNSNIKIKKKIHILPASVHKIAPEQKGQNFEPQNLGHSAP